MRDSGRPETKLRVFGYCRSFFALGRERRIKKNKKAKKCQKNSTKNIKKW